MAGTTRGAIYMRARRLDPAFRMREKLYHVEYNKSDKGRARSRKHDAKRRVMPTRKAYMKAYFKEYTPRYQLRPEVRARVRAAVRESRKTHGRFTNHGITMDQYHAMLES